MGIQNNLKIRDTYIINMMLSGNFYGSQIRHWSLGVKFWHRDFFSVLFEALGIFLGFDFCPPFDHSRHLKSGVSPPPPSPGETTSVMPEY